MNTQPGHEGFAKFGPFFASLIGLTLLAAPSFAFFPSRPPNENRGGGEENHVVPDRGGQPPGGSQPPGGETSTRGDVPGLPTDFGPHSPPGGDIIPEMDPGATAAAFALLISGTLMLTDRFRRR
jgi:hypothetical protein